jgi:hypothetical protein
MSKNFVHIAVTATTKREVLRCIEEYKKSNPNDNRKITFDFIVMRIAKYYQGVRF